MPLLIGLIGLPNVGKSTLFNALTQGSADASNYPFCTVEPNVGVVAVPDQRLRRLEALLHPASCTPTAIQFVDIAGLVRGASHGEGLGNQFLSHVREADALVHVVRCFAQPQVVHVEGEVEPVRDVEIVQTELMLADLETVEKAIPRLEKVVQTNPRAHEWLELEVLHRLAAALGRGSAVGDLGLSPEEKQALCPYPLLTAKPVLYLANVGEAEAAGSGPCFHRLAEALGQERVLAVSAQIEAEIAQLPAGERGDFLTVLGLEEMGIDRLIRAGYRLLGLITFYTVAHDKLQAWQLPAGTTAPAAAGRIHTDMEQGFIRAEVASFQELAAAGSLARLREEGRLRTEGHDYVVQDGDVVHFLFR